MKKIDLYLSNGAPNVKNGAAWLKPVDGGYSLYILDNGWKALKLVEDNSTATLADDIVQDLVGSTKDKKTANTINGAKAYADDVKSTVTGKASDTASDLTLYGLKAYIDAATTPGG